MGVLASLALSIPLLAAPTSPPRGASAPGGPNTPPPGPWPGWKRRGLVLRGSTGLVQCGQDVCDTIPIGGLARFTFGYRIGLYSIHLSVDGGGAPLSVADFADADGSVTNIRGDLTFFSVGAGMNVHPVDLGRVDPFVGLTLGYSRVAQRFSSDQRAIDTIYGRAGVTPSVGMDVYVAPRIAVGPRFDVLFPFGGSLCQREDGQENCVNTVDLVDADDAAISRARRRELPRPWSVTVQVTLYFLGR